MPVLANIFIQIVLDIFYWGEGKLPASAISVSTQPGVHGITGVCVYSAAGSPSTAGPDLSGGRPPTQPPL